MIQQREIVFHLSIRFPWVCFVQHSTPFRAARGSGVLSDIAMNEAEHGCGQVS